jgi:SMODS-associating 2TM, beta-strand rich effector domain
VRLTTSQVWVVVGLASLIWLALGVVGIRAGGGIDFVFSLRDTIPLLLFLASLHERWLWRHSWFHRTRVITTPVVIGTWRGTLESFWLDAATGQKTESKIVYLVIRQTATTINVRLLTNESTSEQLAGTVAASESGYPAISYNYRNRPDLKFRKDGKSPIHYGGAVIEIIGDPATGLNGEYWTDRNSRGQFRFRDQAARIAQTFEEAQSLKYDAPTPVGVLREFTLR